MKENRAQCNNRIEDRYGAGVGGGEELGEGFSEEVTGDLCGQSGDGEGNWVELDWLPGMDHGSPETGLKCPSLGLLYLFSREPFLPSCLVGHALQTSQGPVFTLCILKWPAPFSLCRPCLAMDFWLPDLPNMEHSLPSPFGTHWGQALDTFLTSALLQLPDQAPFSPALFLRASSL